MWSSTFDSSTGHPLDLGVAQLQPRQPRDVDRPVHASSIGVDSSSGAGVRVRRARPGLISLDLPAARPAAATPSSRNDQYARAGHGECQQQPRVGSELRLDRVATSRDVTLGGSISTRTISPTDEDEAERSSRPRAPPAAPATGGSPAAHQIATPSSRHQRGQRTEDREALPAGRRPSRLGRGAERAPRSVPAASRTGPPAAPADATTERPLRRGL